MSTLPKNYQRLCWDDNLRKHVICPPTVVSGGGARGVDPPPRCCIESECCFNCNDLLDVFNCYKVWLEQFTWGNTSTPPGGAYFSNLAEQGDCSRFYFTGALEYEIYDKATDTLIDCYKIGRIPPTLGMTVGQTLIECITFKPQTPECLEVAICFELTLIEVSPGVYGYSIGRSKLCLDPSAVRGDADFTECDPCVAATRPGPTPDACCLPDDCCIDCDMWLEIFECAKSMIESVVVPGPIFNATTLSYNVLHNGTAPPCSNYTFGPSGEVYSEPGNVLLPCALVQISNTGQSIPVGGHVVQCFKLFVFDPVCGTLGETPVGVCFKTIAVSIGGISWRNEITDAKLCTSPDAVTNEATLDACVECNTDAVPCTLEVNKIGGMQGGIPATNITAGIPFYVTISFTGGFPGCCGDCGVLFVSSTRLLGSGTLTPTGNPFQPCGDLSALTFIADTPGDKFQLFFEIYTDSCTSVPVSQVFDII